MKERRCEHCGVVFKRKSDRRKVFRYCSQACHHAARSQRPTQHDERLAENQEIQGTVRRLTAQNKRLLSHVRAAERIVQLAADTFAALPPAKAPKVLRENETRSRETALLLLTDHHIGARFTLEEMGGLNAYDIEEYSRRLKYVVRKTIRLTRGRPDLVVPEIVVFLGGDMIDGLIHDSIERNADAAPADQVVIGSWLLAQAIGELAANFERVRVVCAPGNHGRIRKPHEMEAVTQNFDTLLYVLCRQHLRRQQNVSWQIPREWWAYAELEGHGVLCLHGHVGVKGVSGNATFPGYGLRRAADNLQHIQRRLNQPARYIVMGHFHSYFCTSHEEGLLVINGSIMGSNPYALAGGFPYRPAVQVLMLFHRSHGMTAQHLLTPEEHGLTEGYAWRRHTFEQEEQPPC